MNKLKMVSTEKILVAVLLIVLFFTVIINFQVSRNLLDDAAASEMMLANLLYKEKTLFSDNWGYYSEAILYNQIIFSFLFNFFDGWANVRFFGTCLIQLIYLLSFVYMMSQSGLRRDAQLLGAVLIMLPFCVSYGRLFLYHCFYIPKLAPGFLIIGVFFSLLKFETNSNFRGS